MNFLIKGLFKKGWLGLLAILFSVFGGIDGKQLKSAAGQAALQQVQEAQEKRDDINNPSLENVLESKTDRFTQSEAHLFLSKIRDLIEKNYKDKTIPYLNVISTVIANEAE